MNKVILREATAEDAPSLSAVILAAFEEYRGRLDPPSGAHDETVQAIRQKFVLAHAAVASIDQDIVGCAFYEPEADHIYLGRLAVLSQYRRQGIGRKLVAWVEAQARSLGYARVRLAVRVVLTGNRAYFERLGYRLHSYGTHAGYAEPTYLNMEKNVA
jgi:predicted N-acetyltransferase YhbS